MITVAQFLAHAPTMVDVPIHHLGRDRRGVDCVGLPICILTELGMDMSGADSRYGLWPSQQTLQRGLEVFCKREIEVKAGYVIQLQMGAEFRHAAVVLGVNEYGQRDILEAKGQHKRVIRTLLDPHVRVIPWSINGVSY